MAGRHARGEAVFVPQDPFRAYLGRLTLRAYLRDFFAAANHRAIIGFIVGAMFFGFGFGRMFVHPGWQSLGVVFVGFAVAALCFIWPLLRGLVAASFREAAERVR